MGSDSQPKRMFRIRAAMPADPLRQLPHGSINRQHRSMVRFFLVHQVWRFRIHCSRRLSKWYMGQLSVFNRNFVLYCIHCCRKQKKTSGERLSLLEKIRLAPAGPLHGGRTCSVFLSQTLQPRVQTPWSNVHLCCLRIRT